LYPFSKPRFKRLLESKNLIFYIENVDGISITYDIAAIDPDLLITNMKYTHQNFHFKRTLENYENLVDLLLIRKNSLVKLIYIENLPSQIIINNLFSHHPTEHKITGRRYSQPMYAFTPPPFTDTKTKRYFTIKYLASVNFFPPTYAHAKPKPSNAKETEQSFPTQQHNTLTWTRFTFCSPLIGTLVICLDKFMHVLHSVIRILYMIF
jgi:hypothetical protein